MEQLSTGPTYEMRFNMTRPLIANISAVTVVSNEIFLFMMKTYQYNTLYLVLTHTERLKKVYSSLDMKDMDYVSNNFQCPAALDIVRRERLHNPAVPQGCHNPAVPQGCQILHLVPSKKIPQSCTVMR